MVGVPGALSALWLRLRALEGLLGRDLRDRLFQHTICLFPGLRLKRAHSTALSALDVVPQRQASLVLCAYGSVVLACRSRFVTQAPRLRMPSMGPALKTDGRGAGGTLSSSLPPSLPIWPAWPRSLRSSLPAHDLPLPWSSLETRQQHRSLGARCSTPTPSLSCALRLWQRRTCLPLALRHASAEAADAINGTRPQNRWSGCRGHSQLFPSPFSSYLACLAAIFAIVSSSTRSASSLVFA